MKARTKKRWKILIYVLLGIYLVITVYPFLWMIFASFKSYDEIISGSLKLLPETWTLENYKNIIFSETSDLGRWFFNSAFIAITVTISNLILNTLCGYALARVKFRGRNYILYYVIAAMIIPFQILLIPNFVIISHFGWIDTYAALIIPAAINATYIFYMRQFFINFSSDVEESAQIDGFNSWQTFFYIIFPMARPALVTQAIFIFLGSWNNFLTPLLYMKSPEMYTIQVGLQTFQSDFFIDWGAIMACATIAIIPVIILYAVFHKQFFYGLQMKGEK